MKTKRTICLILSIMMALSALSGCQTEPSVSTAPPESSTPAQTQEPASHETPVPDPTEPITEEHSEAYEIIHSILKDSEFYYLDETDALAPYYEMAAQRKEAILNAPTEIVKSETFIPGETYTGTAYYVSPNGNDANDGLSPETAWQSIRAVNNADLQEGDAVFFARGGVYRLLDDRLRLADYVTYSAYGEGAKPVLTLSQENSARSECWELYYEGENGEKIWKFYQDLGEVGGIIFDDETYAARVFELPTTEGWMALDILIFDPANGIYDETDPCGSKKFVIAEEYRTIEDALTENMTFITRVDLSEVSFPSNFAEWRVYGGLYLRCDDGNPGELFSDIEIISRRETADYGMDGILIQGETNGYVLDNLSVKYFISPMVGEFTSSGVVIQNCTFEWGGGSLLNIPPLNEFNGDYFTSSDGIYNVAIDATIRNNYMRQMGCGFTFENSEPIGKYLGTYVATGNLIENCVQGIRTYLLDSDVPFEAIVLQDNMILHTGDNMDSSAFEEPVAIDFGGTNCQFAERFVVSGNIMIGSTVAMMRLPCPDRFPYDFHDNVIAQDKDSPILTVCNDEIEWYWMKDAK